MLLCGLQGGKVIASLVLKGRNMRSGSLQDSKENSEGEKDRKKRSWIRKAQVKATARTRDLISAG